MQVQNKKTQIFSPWMNLWQKSQFTNTIQIDFIYKNDGPVHIYIRITQ